MKQPSEQGTKCIMKTERHIRAGEPPEDQERTFDMIKSIYITFYVVFLLVGGVISTIHFNENILSIGRFAAITAFLTGWIWWIYVFTVRLRNAMFASMVVTVATATSLLIAIGSHYISGDGSLFSVRMCLAALLSSICRYHQRPGHTGGSSENRE